MKKLIIKDLNMSMDLDFDGNLQDLTGTNKGMLFQLSNNDVFINAYLQIKPETETTETLIKKQLEFLKKQNFSTSKINFFKNEVGDLKKAKTSVIKPFKTQFESSYVVIIENKQVEQMQFYVEVKQYVLIIGLIVKGKSFSSKDKVVLESVDNVIKGIKSLS